jgi:hypothetical protein
MFGLSGEQFWSAFDYDFWACLPKTRTFDLIVDQAFSLFPPEQIYVVSSASLRSGCCDGKREWCEKNLRKLNKNHLIFTSEKQLLAKPNRILVDDYDVNLSRWKSHGGLAVRVNRPWNSGHGEGSTFSGYCLFNEEAA